LRAVFGADGIVGWIKRDASVLAILGLVEYARPGHVYEQGRAQAIWALVLSLIFLTAFGVGIARAGNGSSIRAPVQAAAGQTLKFDELNFQFTVPGKPWVQLDAPKLNRAAKLGFMRARPNVYCIIIAEELGTGILKNEGLAEVATTQMRSAADSKGRGLAAPINTSAVSMCDGRSVNADAARAAANTTSATRVQSAVLPRCVRHSSGYFRTVNQRWSRSVPATSAAMKPVTRIATASGPGTHVLATASGISNRK
jgi:hypothetical protein